MIQDLRTPWGKTQEKSKTIARKNRESPRLELDALLAGVPNQRSIRCLARGDLGRQIGGRET
jgi:hypothetical protein